MNSVYTNSYIFDGLPIDPGSSVRGKAPIKQRVGYILEVSTTFKSAFLTRIMIL